jgi:hypothetical protein
MAYQMPESLRIVCCFGEVTQLSVHRVDTLAHLITKSLETLDFT